jgi:hypothetical protein
MDWLLNGLRLKSNPDQNWVYINLHEATEWRKIIGFGFKAGERYGKDEDTFIDIFMSA